MKYASLSRVNFFPLQSKYIPRRDSSESFPVPEKIYSTSSESFPVPEQKSTFYILSEGFLVAESTASMYTWL